MTSYRKYGYGLGLIAIAVLFVAAVASAQIYTPPATPTTPPAPTDTTTDTTTPTTPQTGTDTPDAGTATTPTATEFPAPMQVDIDGGGNGLIRGVVESTGTNSITVSTWGGTWTIRTDTTSSVIPAGSSGASDLSAIQTGHFVGAEGTVANDGSTTMNATFVRNWTTNPYTGPLMNTGTGDTIPQGVGGEGDASGGPTFTPGAPLNDGTDTDTILDEDDLDTNSIDGNDTDTIEDEDDLNTESTDGDDTDTIEDEDEDNDTDTTDEDDDTDTI